MSDWPSMNKFQLLKIYKYLKNNKLIEDFDAKHFFFQKHATPHTFNKQFQDVIESFWPEDKKPPMSVLFELCKQEKQFGEVNCSIAYPNSRIRDMIDNGISYDVHDTEDNEVGTTNALEDDNFDVIDDNDYDNYDDNEEVGDMTEEVIVSDDITDSGEVVIEEAETNDVEEAVAEESETSNIEEVEKEIPEESIKSKDSSSNDDIIHEQLKFAKENNKHVIYEKNGNKEFVTISKIHYDDPKPYYTIKFSDGQERATIVDKLSVSNVSIYNVQSATTFYNDVSLREKAIHMIHKNKCGNIYGFTKKDIQKAFKVFCIHNHETCKSESRFVRYSLDDDGDMVALIIYCNSKNVKEGKQYKTLDITSKGHYGQITFQLFDKIVKRNILEKIVPLDKTPNTDLLGEVKENFNNHTFFNYHELIFICSDKKGEGSRLLNFHISELNITTPTILMACQAVPMEKVKKHIQVDEQKLKASTMFYEHKMSFYPMLATGNLSMYKGMFRDSEINQNKKHITAEDFMYTYYDESAISDSDEEDFVIEKIYLKLLLPIKNST